MNEAISQPLYGRHDWRPFVIVGRLRAGANYGAPTDAVRWTAGGIHAAPTDVCMCGREMGASPLRLGTEQTVGAMPSSPRVLS